MRNRIALLVAGLGLAVVVLSNARAEDIAPASVKILLAEAQVKAKAQKKPVLVMFHASWCGWCKRLEAVMARPEFKKLMDENYVVLPLDVMENGDKKATLENPGGLEYMKELGGEKSGLPYYAFVDPKGKVLAD